MGHLDGEPSALTDEPGRVMKLTGWLCMVMQGADPQAGQTCGPSTRLDESYTVNHY